MRGSESVIPFSMLRKTLRWLVVLNWAVIVAVLVAQGVSKPLAMTVFAAFRVSAVTVGLLLLVEALGLLRGRAAFRGVILDAILAFSMFLFWFFVRAATF